jgi:hypothetical protein
MDAARCVSDLEHGYVDFNLGTCAHDMHTTYIHDIRHTYIIHYTLWITCMYVCHVHVCMGTHQDLAK